MQSCFTTILSPGAILTSPRERPRLQTGKLNSDVDTNGKRARGYEEMVRRRMPHLVSLQRYAPAEEAAKPIAPRECSTGASLSDCHACRVESTSGRINESIVGPSHDQAASTDCRLQLLRGVRFDFDSRVPSQTNASTLQREFSYVHQRYRTS